MERLLMSRIGQEIIQATVALMALSFLFFWANSMDEDRMREKMGMPSPNQVTALGDVSEPVDSN